MKLVTWTKPAILYVIDLNGMTKFGITINWHQRKKQYQKDYPDLPLSEIKQFSFDKRWKAELVEQMMSRRLKQWLAKGRYEWVIDLPIQAVLDCFNQVREVLNQPGEYQHASTIYLTDSRRFAFYDQLFDLLEEKFNQATI